MEETYFAPAKRTAEDQLNHHIQMVSHSPLLKIMLHTLEGVMVVLDENRMIVGFNHAFLDTLDIKDAGKALGVRLGESVGCVHAEEMPAGCGTSKSCGSCGMALAVMSCLETQTHAEQICALEVQRVGVPNRSMSLQVRASPLKVDGYRLLIITLKDITREQMRANLERVFYHDINNILSALIGPSELLLGEMPGRWEVVQIFEAGNRLRQEISLQRELTLSDGSNFVPERSQVPLSEINKDIEFLLRNHRAVRDRTITATQDCPECLIFTDKMLVSRVLANMLINALEATAARGEVKFNSRREQNRIVWEVWNDTYIDEAIQPRIFQRHFSTKADVGRGLGTFSMKLFGESYLKGSIDFSSDKESGTVFTFSLPIQLSGDSGFGEDTLS